MNPEVRRTIQQVSKIQVPPETLKLIEQVSKIQVPPETLKLIEQAQEDFWRALGDFAKSHLEPIQRTLAQFRHMIPPNVDLVDYAGAADLARQEGFGVAWALPKGLVAELLSITERSDRSEKLRTAEGEIVCHCGEALSSRSGALVRVAAEVVDLYQEGRLVAAQSVASNVIDEWLGVEAAEADKRKAALVEGAKNEPFDEEQYFRLAVRNLVLAGVTRSWTGWNPNSEPLTEFSRHQTAHHISHPDSVNEWKALQALTIATSVACHHGTVTETMRSSTVAKLR